jgi:hypothetical protein
MKKLVEKSKISKYYFLPFYSNLCKLACKGMSFKYVYKDCIFKTTIEDETQGLFEKKYFYLISKDSLRKP